MYTAFKKEEGVGWKEGGREGREESQRFTNKRGGREENREPKQ